MDTIEKIDRKWKLEADETLNKLESSLGKTWKIVKKEMKKIVEWYWFDNSKTPGEKSLHIIMHLLITRAIIRIFYNV